MNRYRTEINEGTQIFWSIFWKFVIFVIIATAVGFGIKFLFFPVKVTSDVLNKVVNADNIVGTYEQFQEMYNTCKSIDSNLATICRTPDTDAMFAQFSKGAMIAARRQQLVRWVNEYNAKSRMITRQYWKSPKLPYQLNEEDFQNYNCQ